MVGDVSSGNGAIEGMVTGLGRLRPIQEPAIMVSLTIAPKSQAKPYANLGDPTKRFACHSKAKVGPLFQPPSY